ncbi:MAG: hypothetical protein BWK80_17015, partial [Desulfobacteraceae bacterium IS3]
ALQFFQGKQAHDKGDFDSAIRCYETARAFWKGKDREHEGVLLYFIAKSYEGKNDPKTALSFFRECIGAFAGNAELKTRCMLDLCGLLKTSGDCKELETLAENALQLAQTCGNEGASASCRLFFVENALSHSDQERAEKEMQEVLNIVFPDAGLNLTQADKVLDYLKDFLESREDAGEKIPLKSNPKIYIRILDALHDIYVAKRQYLQAFQAKQAKYSLEYWARLRAFIGAVRLKPSRMARLGDFPVTEEIEASGRKDDIEKLMNKLGEPQCKVIVFHGNSGVGKSSVLEAGLEPKLKNDVVGNYNRVAPILIRSYADWAGEMFRVLKAFNASRGEQTSGDILSELQRNHKQNILTVLIFDQFEEFFFAHQPEERRKFFLFLKECLEIIAVKIIFSLREDYIHYLLEYDRQVEFDILSKTFRITLGNFTRAGAKSVIQSLTRRSRSPLDDGLIDKILDDLAVDNNGVRPIELQIVGSQIETKGIHTSEAFKDKAELIRAFLEEAVQDCGTENEDIARLLLYLLTNKELTRPLKSRAEIAYELHTLARDTKIEVKDGQLTTVLEILTLSGMIFLVPGQTDKYQLVHDYLTGLIREQTKPLLEKLDNDRKEKEIQRRVAEEEEKRQLEHAKEIKVLLEKANYNLAKVFEEKAGNVLDRALESKEPDDFQQAWLYTLTALQQDIGNKNLPLSVGRLANPELRSGMAPYLWTSPELSYVNSVAYGPDGMLIASGSDDKTVRLWDAETGRELRTFIGHSSSVNSVSFSADGARIASGSDDVTVRVWDAISGAEIFELKGHSNTVSSVAFSPDGKRIASGSSDDTVRLWDAVSGAEIFVFRGHSGYVTSVAYSPDGTRIASGSGFLYSSEDNNTVRMWDAISGAEIAVFRGHSGSVRSVAYSPDGKRIASGSGDNTVRVWKLDLINEYLKHGKDSPLFQKICKLSFDIFPYRLEDITLVESEPRRSLPPRPPHKDPVEWMIENIEKMSEP